jgi:hypothetical protein
MMPRIESLHWLKIYWLLLVRFKVFLHTSIKLAKVNFKINILCVFLITVQEYVSRIDGHPELQDKLCHRSYETDSKGQSKTPLFPVHLPPEEVHIGVKSGKLLRGTFFASRDNFLEGSVNIDGVDMTVSINLQ